ncbi:hypothetical protein EHH54_32440 [Rhizobium leguminosarum]|uniref:hypothetical protein n=1 Tax=Rhizobium leguminosarum TaxID=384 RepID=UPI000FEC31F9|nr:hypothetical protein [Rhizobium leguminosarum]RWX28467.1 hypothetical protein EHH54_32440 [Rhizobium leguminosarum]
MMLMEVQATGAVAVEVPERRSRVYEADWTFRIGQAVKFDELAAIVLWRMRSAMGKEICKIWISGEAHGRPLRMVDAKKLK